MNSQGNRFSHNIPVVTKNLIIINIIFWIASLIMAPKINLSEMLGLHFPASRNFQLYQLVTYMFMHASLPHIFFNMFAVYMFGRVLESEWGQKRFFTYYMVTGIGAAVFNLLVAFLRIKSIEGQLPPGAFELVYENGIQILRQEKNYADEALGQLNLLVNSTTVGASGAVFGILLAFGMMFPNMPLYIIPFPFPIKAKYLVTFYGVLELFAGIANFSFDNVAHFAHLGGMLFGIVMVLYWRKKDKKNDWHY